MAKYTITMPAGYVNGESREYKHFLEVAEPDDREIVETALRGGGITTNYDALIQAAEACGLTVTRRWD